MEKAKKTKIQLSTFSIIFIILIGLALLTLIVPDVEKATVANVVMAPYNGFKSAMDVCVFVLVLGGYLNVIQKTGTLDAGVQTLVKKMNGKEIWLIPILMCLFALGGTTYGMSEETVAFYALICVTMVAVGFDTLTAAATILLGAGIGTLASTVNPFATGIASDTALQAGVEVNQGVVIGLGIVILIINLAVSIWFVMSYAKKVQERNGSFLSINEKSAMLATFQKDENEAVGVMTGRQKAVLGIFSFGFLLMVFSVIPWDKFGIEIPEWTGFLTGAPLGAWWFGELAMWFLILSIVVGIVAKMKEKMIVDAFVEGAADIVSVALIIAVARGASVLMSETHLDAAILTAISSLLQNVPGAIFAPISYLFYLVISFFIPSTSGAATLTMPIMAPLTNTLEYVAQQFFTNKTTVAKVLREVFSLTFVQLLSRMRLHKSVELLLTTNKTLDDIAKCVGYFDSAHFTKQFESAYLMTPIAYRKKYAGEELLPLGEIEKVVEYVRTHFSDESMRLHQIAKQFAISPATLNTWIVFYTECTFEEWIHQLRMNYAVYLLRSTALTVLDIAITVGYTNTRTFQRIFEQHFYTTPAQYRKM